MQPLLIPSTRSNLSWLWTPRVLLFIHRKVSMAEHARNVFWERYWNGGWGLSPSSISMSTSHFSRAILNPLPPAPALVAPDTGIPPLGAVMLGMALGRACIFRTFLLPVAEVLAPRRCWEVFVEPSWTLVPDSPSSNPCQCIMYLFK